MIRKAQRRKVTEEVVERIENDASNVVKSIEAGDSVEAKRLIRLHIKKFSM
jgi:hypothetical protein